MTVPTGDRAVADQLVGLTGLNSSGTPTTFVESTTNGDLQSDDATRNVGLDTIITLTGSAVELKIGASRLATRKYIIIESIGDSTIWGFTTGTPFDAFKNQLIIFPAGPNTPVYINGVSGVQVKIGEA